MADVVIYSHSYCPYSKDCKKFFEEKNVKFHEIVVDDDPALKAEMETKSGGRKDTPQIFINEHHIGSFDDIKAIESVGKLDEMLNV